MDFASGSLCEICGTCSHRQLKSRADRHASSTYRAAFIMMKTAVVGTTGPAGIHLVTELRKTVASVRVLTHSCDSSHSFPPFAQVTFWLVNG